jgi:hypothetical protein
MPPGFMVAKDGREWAFIAKGNIVLDTSEGQATGYTRWSG